MTSTATLPVRNRIPYILTHLEERMKRENKSINDPSPKRKKKVFPQ